MRASAGRFRWGRAGAPPTHPVFWLLQALALLALGLLVAETSAIRLFDHKHPMKRAVGRRRRGRDGKYVSCRRRRPALHT